MGPVAAGRCRPCELTETRQAPTLALPTFRSRGKHLSRFDALTRPLRGRPAGTELTRQLVALSRPLGEPGSGAIVRSPIPATGGERRAGTASWRQDRICRRGVATPLGDIHVVEFMIDRSYG